MDLVLGLLVNKFNKFEKTCRNGVNYFSSILLQGLKDGRWSLKDVGKKNFQDVLRKAEECIEFFARFNLTVPRVQRSVCSLAIRFYKGYKQRNKKLPKRAPFLKENKAMFFCDGVISGLQYYGDDGKKKRLKSVVYDEVKKNNKYELKGELDLKTFGDKQLKVLFRIPYTKGMVHKIQYLATSPGGNIDKKNGRIVFVVKVPFKWKYQPETDQNVLGFDINKNKDNFIYFSEAIKLYGSDKSSQTFKHGRNSYVLNLEAKLKELNNIVNSKEFDTYRRRRIRKAIKKRHRQLNRIYAPICQSIIDFVVSKKMLLCIDDLSCGANHGSFGQDKIVPLLTTLCENQRVPHVVVPTPYTSKVCTNCGEKSEDRPSHDELICKNCGPLHAHNNAAQNIKKWGWNIWQEGFFKFKSKIFKKYKGPKSSLDNDYD